MLVLTKYKKLKDWRWQGNCVVARGYWVDGGVDVE